MAYELSATVTGVALLTISAALWRASRADKGLIPPPDAVAMRKWYGELTRIVVHSAGSTATANPPVASPETAILLLDEARAAFEWNQAAEMNVESKATTLLTIIAGAAGALGVFGVTKEGKFVNVTPLALIAITFAVGALVCLLYVLRPKAVARPDSAAFASGPTVSDDNRARLAVMLVGMYARDTYDNAKRFRYSRPMIFVAYVCVATAAALTVINVATAGVTAPTRTEGPVVRAQKLPQVKPRPTSNMHAVHTKPKEN